MSQIGSLLAEMARKGAQHTHVERRMCNGCAFKKGTPANGEKIAATNALDALLSDQMEFGCHEDRNQLCTGYLYAKHCPE